jgi:uncharacterized protein
MPKPLPMLGRTHGTAARVTCHFKCDSVCTPTSQHQHRAEFRRDRRPSAQPALILVATGSLAAAAALPTFLAGCTPGERNGSTGASESLSFDPIAPVPEKVDAITVPDGYHWTPILRWDHPLFADSPDFAPGSPNAAAQALQFGYNNDFWRSWISTAQAGQRCCAATMNSPPSDHVPAIGI